MLADELLLSGQLRRARPRRGAALCAVTLMLVLSVLAGVVALQQRDMADLRTLVANVQRQLNEQDEGLQRQLDKKSEDLQPRLYVEAHHDRGGNISWKRAGTTLLDETARL